MIEKIKDAALWARKAHSGSGVVVAFASPLPFGVAEEVKAIGLKATKFFPLPGGDFVAVLLMGEPRAKAALLEAIPEPRSHGSRTAGNLLPK